MKRLLTAAVGAPLVVAAIFKLSTWLFFAVVLVAVGLSALELSRLIRPLAPSGPLWVLPLLLPALSAAIVWTLLPGGGDPMRLLVAGGLLMTVGSTVLVLASGVEMREAPVSLGLLVFGAIYFSLPIAAVTALQVTDPWLVMLLLGIVWLGDTAAFYVGSSLGRRKLAPRISPNKSWEGSIASFVTALVATVAWCLLRLPDLDLRLLVVAAVTAVVAQMGDLLESLLKRSVGVKDSGTLLPGHGGLLDRLDALLLAAPVFYAGLWWLDWPGLVG